MVYNEITVLDGKEVLLSREEKAKVDEFHMSRVAFAILKDGSCAINVKDVREHRVYLQEDYGVSFEEFENLVRGFIKFGRIVFYKTLSFTPIENIPEEVIKMVAEVALNFFGAGEYEIWNGLKISKLGEEWEPVQKKGIVKVGSKE